MNNLFSHKRKGVDQRGFTLVELLVSVALFAIVMTVSIGAVLAVVDSNKKAQSLKSVMNNLNFAVENMTRTIKTGTDYTIGGSPSDQGGSTSLEVINSEGKNVTYKLSGTQMYISGSDYSGDVPITAQEITIEKLSFTLIGAPDGDKKQPKVTIVIKGYAGSQLKTRSNFSIQTTISQRLINS